MNQHLTGLAAALGLLGTVAALELRDGDARGGGEPFRLGNTQGVLTCAHLLQGGDVRIGLGPDDWRTSDTAFRLRAHRDLMFLPLETAPEPVPSAAPHPGETVRTAAGNGTVTRLDTHEFELTAPFGPGDSGRGVWNAAGELVGLCAVLETDAKGKIVKRIALRTDGLQPGDFTELPAELPTDGMTAAELRRRISAGSNRDGWTLLAGPVYPTSARQAAGLLRERRAFCRMLAALGIPPDSRWKAAGPPLVFPGDRFDELAAAEERRLGPPHFRADARPGNDYRCRLWRGAFLTLLPDGRSRLSRFHPGPER